MTPRPNRKYSINSFNEARLETHRYFFVRFNRVESQVADFGDRLFRFRDKVLKFIHNVFKFGDKMFKFRDKLFKLGDRLQILWT